MTRPRRDTVCVNCGEVVCVCTPQGARYVVQWGTWSTDLLEAGLV